jgi:FkbM family methyltransferase
MNRFCSALLYRFKTVMASSAIASAARRSRIISLLLELAKNGASALLHRKPVWLQVRNGPAAGSWLRLQLPAEAGYWIAAHEPDVQELIAANLKAGQVSYDVGAHIGFCTAAMARAVGPLGRVVAFDGDSENVKRLHEHIERNGWSKSVAVVHSAVWTQTLPSIGFRRGGTIASRGGVESGAVRPVLGCGELSGVPAIALDDYARLHDCVPDFVKVDVEGAEAEVLRGATAIARDHGPLFVVEVHHAQAAAEIEIWLRELSYDAEWRIPPEGFPRRLVAIPATVSTK